MTLEEAKARAAEEAAARGWPWRGTITAQLTRSWLIFGRALIEVHSNSEQRGSNALFVFDATTGEITRAAYLPR